MVLSHLFGKETVVGIDIGSSTIKAVEIEPHGSGWRLASAALQPTPPGSVRDGIITDIVEVSSAVRTLLRSAGIKANGAVAAISGSQVIVRQVQFPTMSEDILRKSIRFEASKFISTSMDDSVVEFEILGEAAEAGQMNVMLVAAPREMVESRVAVIESAGLEPLAIDIEAFCLIRALIEASGDAGAPGSLALIDMGASHTDINIVSRGQFALTRSVPIAGASFTNAIKTLTAVDLEEAERIKLQMSLEEQADTESENSRCLKAVQPLLDELLREVRRSIHFYQTQFAESTEQGQVSRIILCGGTSRMPGMASYVSSRLNVPAEVGDVFEQGRISCGSFGPDFTHEHGPLLPVAVGLALKEEMSSSKLPQVA